MTAPVPPAPFLRLSGLTRIYGRGDTAVPALRGIDLTLSQGDFLAVMGASGSGKSTLMNILGCLDTPSSGQYRFGDIAVETLNQTQRALLRRHRLGFVFQGFNLLARTTAQENVELPLLYRGLPAARRRQAALEALDLVGLSDRARHTPAELSGGQQQRVAIARAIVTDPAMLLADEPTGNLDSNRSHAIMDLLCRLNRDRRLTIIMVTHEDDMAAYAGRTLHLRDGQIAEDSAARPPAETPACC